MTRFWFIRHGETDWNVQGRFQGQIDVPLNAAGHAQAARLAARLAATPADVLYASDLQRARQTAEPLARAWSLPARPAPALREQSFGVVEGLTLAAVEQEHPALWRDWLAHQSGFALPGGESLAAVSARVLAGVRAMAAEHAGAEIAVVTHGGVLDVLWRHAQGLPLDGRRSCAIPNTGISRLRWSADTLTLETWGDDAHLRVAHAEIRVETS